MDMIWLGGNIWINKYVQENVVMNSMTNEMGTGGCTTETLVIN